MTDYKKSWTVPMSNAEWAAADEQDKWLDSLRCAIIDSDRMTAAGSSRPARARRIREARAAIVDALDRMVFKGVVSKERLREILPTISAVIYTWE
jgi:hypothetical protein